MIESFLVAPSRTGGILHGWDPQTPRITFSEFAPWRISDAGKHHGTSRRTALESEKPAHKRACGQINSARRCFGHPRRDGI
jgi:hypothetical protein